MRILLSILLGLSVLPSTCSCSVNKPSNRESSSDVIVSYEIIIRLFETGNVIDSMIELFSRNGLRITNVQETYLLNERQEIKIIIKATHSIQLNELKGQLKEVMNVESVLISRR